MPLEQRFPREPLLLPDLVELHEHVLVVLLSDTKAPDLGALAGRMPADEWHVAEQCAGGSYEAVAVTLHDDECEIGDCGPSDFVVESLWQAPAEWVFVQHQPRGVVEEPTFFRFADLERLANEFKVLGLRVQLVPAVDES